MILVNDRRVFWIKHIKEEVNWWEKRRMPASCALFILHPLVTKHFICSKLLQDPLECTLMAALKQFKVNNNSCCVPPYHTEFTQYTIPPPSCWSLPNVANTQCAVAGSYRARCLVLTCSRLSMGVAIIRLRREGWHALWHLWVLMRSARYLAMTHPRRRCLNNGARLQLLFLMGPWIPGTGRWLSLVISHKWLTTGKNRDKLWQDVSVTMHFVNYGVKGSFI